MSSSEQLQKVLKTYSDSTRVRILLLLEREELAVHELMEVLSMTQSRVSRHLGILRESGLLRDRREGTFVHYRFAAPEDGPWREAWELIRRSIDDDPATVRDLAALDRVIEARATRSRSFFDSVGPEWEGLRKVFGDDVLRARALARLAPPGLRVVDVGTGTGTLARDLARAGLEVVAVDHSRRMLDATAARLEAEGIEGVDLRRGDAADLPLRDGEVHAAFAHMVLQYLASPADAIREMARVIAPGGAVVIVDFVRHDREWMQSELGVLWLGFDPDEIEAQLRDAGLGKPRIEIHPPAARGADLPDTLIASARKPEGQAAERGSSR
ncbi:MAG: metalloregulator ArsR/SmtB family transcription factor [Myxococcota bacterium]|nr:metalloregulator ArsR/SmtB family transcription factor [Myxococcota bacterium]